ncbi:hypothetical protein DFJ77DRAFT_437472 [Powellomyces hirtus]|nr:hypothetical protein DFJ77DRAFT_437472 [Powellomyces hirtus]
MPICEAAWSVPDTYTPTSSRAPWAPHRQGALDESLLEGLPDASQHGFTILHDHFTLKGLIGRPIRGDSNAECVFVEKETGSGLSQPDFLLEAFLVEARYAHWRLRRSNSAGSRSEYVSSGLSHASIFGMAWGWGVVVVVVVMARPPFYRESGNGIYLGVKEQQ